MNNKNGQVTMMTTESVLKNPQPKEVQMLLPEGCSKEDDYCELGCNGAPKIRSPRRTLLVAVGVVMMVTDCAIRLHSN